MKGSLIKGKVRRKTMKENKQKTSEIIGRHVEIIYNEEEETKEERRKRAKKARYWIKSVHKFMYLFHFYINFMYLLFPCILQEDKLATPASSLTNYFLSAILLLIFLISTALTSCTLSLFILLILSLPLLLVHSPFSFFFHY